MIDDTVDAITEYVIDDELRVSNSADVVIARA